MNPSALRIPIRRIYQFVQNTVRDRFNRHSYDDDSASRLALYQKNDPTRNAETTPPEDDRPDLPCIWAVEFYTPSYVDKLVDHLEKLGWDQNDLLGRESPASWVRTSRQYSEGGSWFELGTIRSDNDKRPWPSTGRTAPLPKYVRYAGGGIYSLTPSLTCIVICFVFEDEFRCRLDSVLRRHRQTFTQPVSRSANEIFDPERQKTNEVRQLRQECVNLAATWFRENLPGVFSSGLLGDQLPTFELVTLKKAEPFPDPEGEEYTSTGYLRVLGLQFSASVWKSKDTPNLKFSLDILGQNLEYHSVFAARTTEIDDGFSTLDTLIDTTYREMIGRVAIRALLDGYSRRLNELRDTVTARILRQSRLNPAQTLEVLVSNVAYDVDIPAVATDLIVSTEESSGFFRDLSRFEPCYNWVSRRDSLAGHFCPVVNRHAMRLKQTAQSLRDHLTQFGSLIAATENVRTQVQIVHLTRILAVLTIILAVMAALTFSSSYTDLELGVWFQDTWRHLRLWRG